MRDMQKGHRVPLLFEVPGLARYLEYRDPTVLQHKDDNLDFGQGRDAFTQRLDRNAFMSFYVSQS